MKLFRHRPATPRPPRCSSCGYPEHPAAHRSQLYRFGADEATLICGYCLDSVLIDLGVTNAGNVA